MSELRDIPLSPFLLRKRMKARDGETDYPRVPWLLVEQFFRLLAPIVLFNKDFERPHSTWEHVHQPGSSPSTSIHQPCALNYPP